VAVSRHDATLTEPNAVHHVRGRFYLATGGSKACNDRLTPLSVDDWTPPGPAAAEFPHSCADGPSRRSSKAWPI
jgi:hypothetical protein